MKYYKLIIIWLVCLVLNLCLGGNIYTKVKIVDFNISFRRVRNLPELTPQQKELKAILDDPTAQILDKKFLVNGTLEPVLLINSAYREKYEQKAKQLLVEIYEKVLSKEIGKFPNGVWTGIQGNINAGILVRYVIEEKEIWVIDKDLPNKITADWFSKIGLRGMLTGKFDDSPLAAMKFAYPDKFWDPDNWGKPFLWFDHDFSPQGIWSSTENDHYVQQLIRYKIEREMGWAIDKVLSSKITQGWFESTGLSSMIQSKFNDSPLAAMKFAYPDKFWDPDNWDKPFLWFNHDFSPHGIWSSADNDRYVQQLIRYKIERVMGWAVDQNLAGKVTQDWFGSVGLLSMLDHKFNGSPLAAMKFVYPEKFYDGTLKEGNFKHLVSGRGEAAIIQPPAKLTVSSGYQKSIDSVDYYFGPIYSGYLVSKLSEDYGGLFDPSGVLIKVFPLMKDQNVKYVNVYSNHLLWDVPEEFDSFMLLRDEGREAEALGIIQNELGIAPFSLTLRERTALANIFSLEGMERLRQYYNRTGLTGIKVLANLTDYRVAFQVVEKHSDDCSELLANYGEIYELGQGIKTTFGEQAPGYVARPENFPNGLGALKSLEYGVFNSLSEANNDILVSFAEGRVSVATAKLAQEELLTILRVQKGWIDGPVRIDRETDLSNDVQEGLYYVGVDGHEKLVRVITRPQEIKTGNSRIDGEASIRFTIEPGAVSELGFRVDRTYNEELGKYVVTVDIVGRNLSRTGDYHHPIESMRFMDLADEIIFANLVRAFRR